MRFVHIYLVVLIVLMLQFNARFESLKKDLKNI